MTASERVAGALRSTGLPFTYLAWPTGHAPALPWCVWLEDDHGEFYADDSNYAALPRIRVELYQSEHDESVTAKVRDALRVLGPTSERTDWVESEGCEMTSFEFTERGVD